LGVTHLLPDGVLAAELFPRQSLSATPAAPRPRYQSPRPTTFAHVRTRLVVPPSRPELHRAIASQLATTTAIGPARRDRTKMVQVWHFSPSYSPPRQYATGIENSAVQDCTLPFRTILAQGGGHEGGLREGTSRAWARATQRAKVHARLTIFLGVAEEGRPERAVLPCAVVPEICVDLPKST
jgi:hypothetical protein